MKIATQTIETAEDRRQAILGAAFEAFRQYGFRRTSMEDIARLAGLSRASLYLHYKNKQDIFRSLVQHYFDQTEIRIREALRPGMSPSDAIAAIVAAKNGPEIEAMHSSPHGDELLDANFTTSADIVRSGEERIARLLSAWLAAEASANRVSLRPYGNDPEALAQTIVAALIGLKSSTSSFAEYSNSAQRLAKLFGRALST